MGIPTKLNYLTICIGIALSFPTSASAENPFLILKFNDGSTQCGRFYIKDKFYCKLMPGGEVCSERSAIVRTAKTNDCDEGGFEQLLEAAKNAAKQPTKVEVQAKKEEPPQKVEAVKKVQMPAEVATGGKGQDCVARCIATLEKVYRKINYAELQTRCAARCQ